MDFKITYRLGVPVKISLAIRMNMPEFLPIVSDECNQTLELIRNQEIAVAFHTHANTTAFG